MHYGFYSINFLLLRYYKFSEMPPINGTGLSKTVKISSGIE